MPKTQQPYDHDEMSLRGRIGAHRQHSLHDARDTTRAAHEGAWASFLKRVDPHDELDEAERWRRAKHAQRARMLELARLSAQKRKARKVATQEPPPDVGRGLGRG
jgi:hypothetical protein